MEDPKRNQNSGQNQSDLNQDDSGQIDQGRAGGIAETDDTTQEDTTLNQSNDDMNTEE